MKNNYTKNLENVIKQMLQPIKRIPFNLVIEAISDCSVLPFDSNNDKDKKVLETLIEAVNTAGAQINREGIKRSRPNEVGNDVELFVKKALNQLGYTSNIPTTASGKKRSVGYPDIEFTDEFSRIHYLECKTYNINSISTTLRSFYLSPSEDFKVIHDAIHFAVSYEIYVSGTQGKNKIYKCRAWKILSLGDLTVDVKYEFQSDNKRLYSKELVLAEGRFSESEIGAFF